MKTLPEFANIETFGQFLLDEDREEFTHEDLAALNASLNRPVREIRAELESFGFRLATRANEVQVRGFSTSSNDRWFGPGACKTHGGSGISVHTGVATGTRMTQRSWGRQAA